MLDLVAVFLTRRIFARFANSEKELSERKPRVTNMKILNSGTRYQIYDSSIRTYDSLPPYTYAVGFSKEEGCFLIRREDMCVSEKTYGVHREKADKVMRSFESFERNLGVILSGDKGIGKSMFAKILCVNAVENGLPVVVVDESYPGIARFIESIDQECLVLFDEFDKTFRSTRDNDDQAKLLSLFDGTAGGKKLFVVTCNELYGLNNYIVNRPGRFHYHFRFDYPSPENVREYLEDKLNPKYFGEIDKVIEFSRKISLNYDCLRAIAFELNSGNSFADAIADLNIMTTEEEEYRVYLFFENGKSLHNLRFSTNLYGYMTYIRFYDNDGNFVLDAHFDKGSVTYDIARGKVVIPAEGIKINKKNDDDDDDYFDDNDDSAEVSSAGSPSFRGVKVTYMSFAKRRPKSLHYAV